MRLVSGIILFLASASSLVALDPALAVSQYLHTNWTQEEGIDLPGIQAIVQTPDGYLWLGTSTGLIRFDGIRFVHWTPRAGEKLPSEDIRFLIASSRGGLWIGSALGISRLDQERLIAYPAANHWLGGPVVAMLEDHLKRLWMLGPASAGSKLGALLPDDSFRVYGQREGLPAKELRSIFESRQHVFWLGTSSGLCRWPPGGPADCLEISPVSVFSIGEEADGSLLIGDTTSRSILRISNNVPQPAITQLEYASTAPRVTLLDRDGNFWIGTASQGLLRFRHGQVERFTRHDGLSSDTINALSEDREGNLWIGTARGIDRFRDPKVAHISSLDGLSSDSVSAVYAARQGGAWVGTFAGLNRVTSAHIARYLTDSGLPSKTVLSLYEEPNGRLWVGTTGGLVHSSGDRFVPVRDVGGEPLDRVFSITGQSNGTIALADGTRGLFTVRGGVLRPMPIPGAQGERIYQLQYDRDGVLWLGYFQGGIAAVTGSSFHLYTTSDGLADGPVRAIYQDAAGDIWVGTGSGLSRFRKGAWTTWLKRNGLPEGGVRSIVEDAPRRALWLVTAAGLLQVSFADLDDANRSGKRANFLLFGQDEGLRLASSGGMVNPPMTKSDDGRIWLCTQDGLAIVDPARIRSNPVPPPVIIEQMTIDGAPLDRTSPSGASFRGSQLQIVYTALSLVAPERIRFKYRLEPLDRAWVEAEGRRNVAYVGLSPGRYRFRVIASNNDGLWNNQGVFQEFTVMPYFYQTWWFIAVCLTTPALIVWGLQALRTRQLVSRLQLISQERARMMRELHDSLLQGFNAVVYQLEAVSRQFDTAPFASKQRLDRAIDQAEQSLQEARRTMMCMRLPALENHTLPEALSAIATQLTKEASIAFSLEVKGLAQHLPYEQQATVYLIGREAVTNSVNHARAARITVTLTYSQKELRLTIQDDGSGFDLQAGMAKIDHWGMRGMRERAEKIKATLTIDTAPGRGTRIELVVPRKG